MNQKRTKRSLNLICLESIITAGLLAAPIMTPFYQSIGMNQEQIALGQAIFTIVALLLNLPTGWIADKFSRKWANVIGDFGCAVTLLFYSQVQNFAGVVACEIAFGVFLSLSQGVDSVLIKHFSGKLCKDDSLFKQKTAKVASWQCIGTLICTLLASPIGAISFRLAIGLSSVTVFVGAILSLFIVDDSEKLQTEYKNPLKDMARIAKQSMQNAKLRHRIFAFAIAREMTHGIIWCFTPILLAARVPLAYISLGWAVNYLGSFIGSRIAIRYTTKLPDAKLFGIPLIAMAISMAIMSTGINPVTISFYIIMGLVLGWTGATMMPMVQNHAKAGEQTTVCSFAKVVAQLLYAVAVWVIGKAADIRLEYAALATLVIFLPLGLIVLSKIRREQ